ncbi:MAG: ABC transporter ATP-binding protein [Candidatus Sumerlaeaceae bacterium]|nr:ABC transporter ATP-binding protein [Candidatus Sumerlaeaceae bacterium]
MSIQFQNVSKAFVQNGQGAARIIQALNPLSMEIRDGEFFSIIGPSGCGKSTLLNLLAGLETSDSGNVTVDNVPVEGPSPNRAVVFQEAGLMPWMTVSRNVEYGLKLQGLSRDERVHRAEKYLKMVHLSKYANAMPHQLSGGMKQRVSIARALALEPKVLLMDEPFSALDAQTRDVLHDEVQRIWQETNTTIVFVTHNIREAVYLSDRVMIMTAPPGSIKRIVPVPFAHPRAKSSSDLSYFTAQLHNQIKEEVDKVAARELDADWKQDAEGLAVAAEGTDYASGI